MPSVRFAFRALFKAPFVTVTHGSPIWTGGAFGPENSPVTIMVMIAACVVLARLISARPSNAG